nr:MAG TPA: hypothetical protein [Caudoviricetes sp.]
MPDSLLSSYKRLQNYRIILNQPNFSFYFSILLLNLTFKYVVKHKKGHLYITHRWRKESFCLITKNP